MAGITEDFAIQTAGRGFRDISRELQDIVQRSGVEAGICNVFLRHTSASLLITENADPDVRADLESFLSRLAPDGDPSYLHSAEGPDDMPAHIRSVLTANELTLPVRGGRLALGTWQGVYLWEHRRRPHRRRLDITVIGRE
ncbi:MAG: secondary thiamine-phosphate synthase enzyme YjbQ [Xanthomonadales bacterium]|jgi:secondary thiamine-phosphate synthase enzyme|nr:secondary thiamine-phosphate synthase enzyme YjbQ [Xanthomonadales bacterium]